LFNERIDHTAHVIGRDEIVQNHRKERALTTAFSLDVSHKW
jgi:hypothetical protein